MMFDRTHNIYNCHGLERRPRMRTIQPAFAEAKLQLRAGRFLRALRANGSFTCVHLGSPQEFTLRPRCARTGARAMTIWGC